MGPLFVISFVSSIAIGLLMGVGFGLAAKERGRSFEKTILVGVLSSLVGGVVGLFIPMLDGYKMLGVGALSFIGSLWGSYAYWVAIRKRSTIAKHVDKDRPETLGRPAHGAK